jgi:hypothetical protein
MRMKNEFVAVETAFDETFTLQSTDNKRYDFVLNPDHLTRNDYHKALSVSVDTGASKSEIAIVCSAFTHDDNFILEDGGLVILLNASVVRVNVFTMQIERHSRLPDFTYFSLHKFEDGYLVHGELDIVRLAKDFAVLWSFSGADIFVAQDGSSSFEIEGANIFLRDWNGKQYKLNKDGTVVSDERKEGRTL